MAARAESETRLELSTLPVDAQASILAFLPLGDLVRFSADSRGYRGVASLDRLWSPMLVQHFGDVQVPLPVPLPVPLSQHGV
jgi:hypothetical protein